MTDRSSIQSGGVSESQLRVGLQAEFKRQVTEADIEAFGVLSGDMNPLHIDRAYAARSQFGRPLAHGAFQVGLASALVGMYLPGERVLLGGIAARFREPLFYPTDVLVRGELMSWNSAARAGQVHVEIRDLARGSITADIRMTITLHSTEDKSSPGGQSVALAPETSAKQAGSGERPRVIVTGAAGGIGQAVVERLATEFEVVAIVRKRPLPSHLQAHPWVHEVSADTTAPLWDDQFDEIAAEGQVFGLVHCCWTGMPGGGGLLDADEQVLADQLHQGSTLLIRLARWLFRSVGDEGGRIVVLGSILGQAHPQTSTASYSLGKMVLEDTVRLLAPELARRRITINAVCPEVVPVGLNAALSERARLVTVSRIPMGRLASAEEIAATMAFLMSGDAGFVSGQSILLGGGQL